MEVAVTSPVPSLTILASSSSANARATPHKSAPALATTARHACPIEMPFPKPSLPDNPSGPRLPTSVQQSYAWKMFSQTAENGASHERNIAPEIRLKSRLDFARATRGYNFPESPEAAEDRQRHDLLDDLQLCRGVAPVSPAIRRNHQAILEERDAQLARITSQSGCSLNCKCPCHAKVMKTFEPVRRTMGSRRD